MDRAERHALVDQVPLWWHSIDVGDGVVTPGRKTPELHASELASFSLPDLRGLSVLDVGAYDGFYSFLAEEQGADRVVALDVWPGGREGFDLAHRLRGSSVEAVQGDFTTMDLAALGTFNVVLFLGVLYHLEDPLGALFQLRQLDPGVLVIETHAVVVPGLEERPMWELYPGSELNSDPTNWWGPNARGVVDACRAAGFGSVSVMDVPEDGTDAGEGVTYYRLVAHARPEGGPAPPESSTAGLSSLRDELEAARRERDALRAELDALKSSRSWRATAPLREAARRRRDR
jgi:tRNA (mo5U34)-methyltransferase